MKNKKLIIALAALIAVIGIAFGLYAATRPETAAGEKDFTVVVIHSDGTETEFPLQSGEEYLGRALVSEGLVEDNQGTYGLYIQEVDGERAVWEENGAYWSIYVGEEPATTGADEIVLTDGGIYKLVYTLG